MNRFSSGKVASVEYGRGLDLVVSENEKVRDQRLHVSSTIGIWMMKRKTTRRKQDDDFQ